MKRLMLCVLLVALLSSPVMASTPGNGGLLRNLWTDVFDWMDYWQNRIFWWPYFDWIEGSIPPPARPYYGMEGMP